MSMLNWEGWAANWLGWGSAGVTPPPPVAGGGGDRGVVLFRERREEPEQLKIPPPIKIRLRSQQAPQESKARIEVESEIRLASFNDGDDVFAAIETSSLLRLASEQHQEIDLAMMVGKVQGRSLPIRPNFESARARLESVGGLNEATLVIEVE